MLTVEVLDMGLSGMLSCPAGIAVTRACGYQLCTPLSAMGQAVLLDVVLVQGYIWSDGDSMGCCPVFARCGAVGIYNGGMIVTHRVVARCLLGGQACWCSAQCLLVQANMSASRVPQHASPSSCFAVMAMGFCSTCMRMSAPKGCHATLLQGVSEHAAVRRHRCLHANCSDMIALW